MKSPTLQEYRNARNAAYKGDEGELDQAPKRGLHRVAHSVGKLLGRADAREATRDNQARRANQERQFTEASQLAKGTNADLLKLIAKVSKDPEAPTNTLSIHKKEAIKRSWILNAAVTGTDIEDRGLSGALPMIEPVRFQFGGTAIPISAFSAEAIHHYGEGVTSTIFLNPHSGEIISDLDPVDQDDGSDPKRIFGNEFRIDIDEAGGVKVMQSTNMITGFGDSNRVTFEGPIEAETSIIALLSDIERTILEQRQFEQITSPEV